MIISASGSALLPTRLRCEYLINPLGIDIRQPRLSWVVESQENGQRQTAYRITAATSEAALLADAPDLWDSGKVESSETVHVPYGGVALQSRQRCFWRVQVWDRDGKPAGVSDVAWFEMGLLEPEDWQAQWISGNPFHDSPRFRRAFTLRRPVASARLYLCGQGVYEASINGRPVSDQVLGPTLSYFAKRMLYDTFDVTALLHEGDNALGVWLAPGWFGDPITWAEMNMPVVMDRFPVRPHALLAQLEVRYKDGSRETLCTDGSWKSAASPLTPVRSHWEYCFGCSGEVFDGTRETPGWDEAGFDDSAWGGVHYLPQPTEELRARMVEPNRVRAVVEPVGCEAIPPEARRHELLGLLDRYGMANGGTTFWPGVWLYAMFQQSYQDSLARCDGAFLGGWVYDLGRHISGWVELEVTGRRGDWACLFGLDCHRLQGVPGEKVRLHFAHRAVRYVPVFFFGQGLAPEVIAVRGLDISSDVERAGRFECSDAALTEVAQVTARTVEAHLLSGMLMDSWQERFGTFMPSEAAVYAWDMAALCTKLTTDFRDQQRPDGWTSMYGAPISLDYPALKESMAHLPWLAYTYYDDRAILEANYDSIRRYTELILPRHDLSERTWRPPEVGKAEAGWGDHGRPTARWYDPHTGDLYETMQMVGYLRVVEAIARLVGEEADAERYREFQARLVDKCNSPRFLDREAGLYGGGDQGCHAQAIVLGIAPPGLRQRVADHLIRDVMETHGGHLDTGFGGTVLLLKALILLDRPDVALRVLTNETPPSLWSMLRHPMTPEPLTILPEFYTGGMIPHPGLSTVGFWAYQSLGGIRPDPDAPGFRRVVIQPQIVRSLEWVRAEYNSIRGKVASFWELDEDRLTLTVTIPANVSAVVHVPADEAGPLVAPECETCRLLHRDRGTAVFEVGSGTYRFESLLRSGAR